MKILRRFSKPDCNVFELFEYTYRSSVLRNPDGSTVFEMHNVEVPVHWSQVATDILAQKYFRKAGVPQVDKDGKPIIDEDKNPVFGAETSIKQVVHRMAACWRDWGERYGYFDSPEDAQAYYDEIAYMLLKQMAAPNSPQWFNTGLASAYGISGRSQGHFFVDPDTGKLTRSEDSYTRPQAHACFIQSVQDDLVNDGGIFDLVVREARVFKFGSGTGTNFSNIRAEGEPLSGGGTSSGLMSFLKIFDAAAGAIKSGGTTRRAAKMVIVNIDHPDIEEFIEWKANEEEKVAAMVAGSKINSTFLKAILHEALENGSDRKTNPALNDLIQRALHRGVPMNYVLRTLSLVSQGFTSLDFSSFDTHYESEAYSTVSGQNSNNTIRLTNEFMQAVENDETWELRWRTDSSVCRTVRAAELWNKIAYSAWKCADPGLQFDTTINEWHTCPNDGRINASNPCVTAETLVVTDRGLERIGDLVGEARGIKSLDGKLHWVEKIFPTGTKPVYELKTKSGYRLKLTGDHLVFTENRGDVKACELTKDDIIRLVGGEFGSETTGSADIAARVGAFVQQTTGSKKHLASVQFEANSTTDCNESEILEKFYSVSEDGQSCIFTDSIFRLSRAEQTALLKGLFTADGTVANYGEKLQYVALDSVSLPLLRQVQLLLLNFGIKAKIYENRRAGNLTAILSDAKGGVKEYPVLEMHSLRISSSSRVRFEAEIGFFPQTEKAKKLAELNQSVSAYAEPLNDKIKSLEYIGEKPVFDLTEPETHHFVANGIGVHNCSEYMFLDDTACNLASLNLIHFVNEKTGDIDTDALRHAARVWTLTLEISVLMAQYPSPKIAQQSYDYRTLGLGFANLGSLLMVSGTPYDSPKALAVAGAISAIMTGEAYATSAEIAADIGAFPKFAHNRDAMLRVVRNHRHAAHNAPKEEYEDLSVVPVSIDPAHCPKKLCKVAGETWDRALKLGEKHGFRNAQVSVIAPTGTIGLVMDCGTTGIEPDFAIVKFKKLAGGGYFKIVNQSVHKSLVNLGYGDEQIVDIENYCKGHGTLEGAPFITRESLLEKGFTAEKLDAVESQLGLVFDIKFAFNKWALGEDFCQTLGFSEKELNDPNFDMLKSLGYAKSEIEAANDYICGTMMIEGAPHLDPEHLPVFDCASKCGRKGQRYINYMAHVRMMAAVQPFISGAISKTVNMPAEATVEQIREVYLSSWQSMLKAIALYRDTSKLSQPLNSASYDDLDEIVMLGDEQTLDETKGPKEVHARVAERMVAHAERRRLPKKRQGYIREAHINGHKVFLRTGEYEDGTLGEIFIDMYKEGASFKGLLNCFAVLASKSLQYGMPLEELVNSFTFTRFEPAGRVDGHEAIKNATSILDYVFRSIGYDYLHRSDFVHVKAVDELPNGNGHADKESKGDKVAKPKQPSPAQPKTKTSSEAKPVSKAHTSSSALSSRIASETQKVLEARVKGYTGEQCPNCASMNVKQNGSCTVCEDCGMTSGCS